ncbi:MAG: MauE/DoxX family redox-associated membrane protein [Bacteroidota bacterium]
MMALLNNKLLNKKTALEIISGLLAAMFFYASFSKLSNYEKAERDMKNQIFPQPIAELLTWLIPLIEILVVLLLLFPQTRKTALWASLALLIVFTAYIALIMTGIFGRIPCSCGGILQHMSYGTHLLFNLFFICISLLGIAIGNYWIYQKWFELKERS